MTPLPKRRHSPSRSAKRFAGFLKKKAIKVLLVKCPNCGQMKKPHLVCPNCGYYRRHQVFEIKEKGTKEKSS